ncbi:hypothetical protein BH11PSE10_BH11PSE10_18590 [soil metagenome]
MATLLIYLVRGYQLLLSSWLGASCRFEPTCSTYAIQAMQRHGAAAGSYLAAARILRCHPFCQGGHDAVPEHPPALFTRFVRNSGPGAAPSRPSNSEASSS